MGLFKLGDFVAHSGQTLHWKIECDALDYADWETFAWVLAQRLPPFSRVIGIPRGGIKLEVALRKYVQPTASGLVLCDDVLTTGGSMQKWRREISDVRNVHGAVAFARSLPAPWIKAAFVLGDLVDSL